MALIDDKEIKTIGENWELLLEGEGIITNMDGPGVNLHFRYAASTPDNDDAYRTIYGRGDNKDSFINQSEGSKIYGKAESGTVKILIARDIQ